MAAPTIYRSTDSGAPVLTGTAGSLTALLEQCLVTGYGGVRATGSIVSSGVNVSNNDTVTLDGITYTFKTALTPTAGEVLIGANAAASLQNLANAMWGLAAPGTTYATGTQQQYRVWPVGITSTTISLSAHLGGTGGNSIALAKSAAEITVSGANLSGGSGSITKSGAGWTKPWVTAGIENNAHFKQGGTNGMYYLVLDDASTTGFAREARVIGSESATSTSSRTGDFPTSASGLAVYVRKSLTVDAVARPWILIADARTFYLIVLTGDSTLQHFHAFGDIYSNVVGDNYKCVIFGGHPAPASGSATTSAALLARGAFANAGTPAGLHFLARNYLGLGGPTLFDLVQSQELNSGVIGTTASALVGTLTFPNPADGGMYIAPVRIVDGGTPSHTSISGTTNYRGYLRGVYQIGHAQSNFANGDTFLGETGTEFEGHTFIILKEIGSSSAQYCAIDLTDWEESA